MRLFLGTLVGFLATMVVWLSVLLYQTTRDAEESILRERETVAAAAVDALEKMPITSRDQADAALILLRGRLGVPMMGLIRGNEKITSGYSGPGMTEVRRVVPAGVLRIGFDDSPIVWLRRRFILTVSICLGGAAAAVMLLLFYVPRITRPIEEMLDHARELGGEEGHQDETRYIIESFKNSIATLKTQEAELHRLHDEQKRRADDLERITTTLTRSLESGFIAIDREGLVLEINVRGRDILGVSAVAAPQPLGEALRGTPFAALLADAFERRRGLAREEIPFDRPDDGRRVIIGLNTVPLFDEQEQFLGMLVLFADLTGVRELEGRVREQQTLAELGEISAGIAHEFRNSLSTILGYLKLAQRGGPDVTGRIQRAEEEAVLLSKAVDALLSFARPIELETSPVALLDLVRETVRRIDDPPTGIEFRIEGDELVADADPILLGRAVENVIRNAVDAIHQKGPTGRIEILAQNGLRPSLTIRDDGIGLDPSQAQRLFLPFQSEKPNGLGLGLAITRKIVLVHGGTISLHGEPGAGATVTIELPAEMVAVPAGER